MSRILLTLLAGLVLGASAFADCMPYTVESYTQGTRLDGGSIAAARSNPANLLGGEPDRSFFSMGFNPGGEVIFALDEPCTGGELTIWETTFLSGSYCLEEAEVYIGDGYSWTYLGLADNDRGAGGDYHPTSFALPTAPGCFTHVRVLDVTALDAGCPGAGDGFDLDAICISGATPCETADAIQEVEQEFALSANYPNPFNPTTTLRYQLPETAEVSLQVVDLQGRVIAQLVNGLQEAGSHEIAFDAGQLPSGVYFSILQSGEFRDVRKMTLIR